MIKSIQEFPKVRVSQIDWEFRAKVKNCHGDSLQDSLQFSLRTELFTSGYPKIVNVILA